MIRIGVDARSLTESQPSGISIYTYHIIEALARIAPDYEFVLFTSGSQLPSSTLLSYLGDLPNVFLHHLGTPNKLFHSLAIVKLAPGIDRYLSKVDVVFAPNINILPISRHTPLVMTWHDVSYKLYNQFLSLRRSLWHTVVAPQTLATRAKHIIAVSQTTKQDLQSVYGLNENKITVIHSGVPKLPVTITTIPELPLVQRPYFLVLSTIEPRKNIAAVLEAYQMWAQQYSTTIPVDLVVVGAAGWKSQSLIRTMQQNPHMHYVGYVSEDQKLQLLRKTRALIYPSIYEGFGLPPLEAMQQGVPVIASWSGALPEILGNAAYYVNPYSVHDLRTALDRIHTNEPLRQYYIEQQTSVLQRYSWERCAQATLKVLHSAI